MLTGETISLFLDRDAIKWGEEWRGKVDESLASIAFFIPVMTPRYFMSAECRRELQFFMRRTTQLGIKELVLPLLYVDVPSIHDEAPKDEIIALVRTFQWEDWRDLRLADPMSEGYRRGVARLATRLVEANRRAQEVDIVTNVLQINQAPDETVDDSPGLIDRLARAEVTLPEWQETIEAIGREIEQIGKLLREATTDLRQGAAQGKGFAAKLIVARRLAHQLGEPIERVWSFGNAFASQLHDVDEGVRSYIERAPAELQERPDAKADVCAFFESVRVMSANTRAGLGALQDMVDSIAPIEKMSRDLRPALRRLRQGLTVMVEVRGVSDEWVHLMEASGIVCESPGTQTD